MAPSRLLAAMLLSALLGTGTALAADPDALQQKLTRLGYEPGENVEKIENYRVDGWNYLDDQHIMIYAGPSRRYMIGLMTTCYDLSTAERIAFTSTVHQLTKFDKLIVRGPGGITQNCPIQEMRELKPIKKDNS